jgi:GT2 family glycosyltransferase
MRSVKAVIAPVGGPMNNNDLPFVSIIVVNYNGKHFLGECFASLESSSYPRNRFEAILVDNASSDDSVGFTMDRFPWVKVLRLDSNYGFCKPNNEGARIARGEYLVFLNNDTVVTKDWLSELVKGALPDDKIVCCASKMLYYDRRDLVNTAGGKITPIGGGFYRGYGDKDGPEYNKLEYTGFGCGAGVLVRKSFFEHIGGFDEDYFAACEEHDLGWKSWLFGYKVLYVPTAVMYHKESGTFGRKGSYQPVKIYLSTRNRLYNLIKNFEAKNVVRNLLISLTFDLYRAIRYVGSGNFVLLKPVARAYLDFVLNLRKMLKKRSFVQKNRQVSDSQLYRLGVIARLAECFTEERRLSKVLKDDFYRA